MQKIVVSPNPILNQVCKPCQIGDKSQKKLSEKMANIMYKHQGIGLAAPQIGILKRIIVVDCDLDSAEKNPFVLINPKILRSSDEVEKNMEGCLSCPGILVTVERPIKVDVEYWNIDGNQMFLTAEGLLSRCLQHEIDHLDGITLFERCDPSEKLSVLQQYEAARAAGAKPGDVSTQ